MTMKHIARRTVGMLLAATVLTTATAAWADYPEKPITIVVPFGPGGTTDLTARAFQKAITDDGLLSQPVVVTNIKGGAVGSVGARHVLDADPDGYTFLLHHIGMMTAGAIGTQEFSYKDFQPVAGTTDFCHVVVVAEDAPWNDLTELLDAAAAEPDSILYGANLGGTLHVAGLLAESMKEGSKFRFVQIGGEADNVTALKGGITQVTTLSTGTFTRYETEGLKALADMAPEREPALGGKVPTSHEQGYDLDFCVQHWWWAPDGTPDDVIVTFSAALEKALENEELKSFFEGRSTLLTYDDGPAFVEKLDTIYKNIEPVAKRAAKK